MYIGEKPKGDYIIETDTKEIMDTRKAELLISIIAAHSKISPQTTFKELNLAAMYELPEIELQSILTEISSHK